MACAKIVGFDVTPRTWKSLISIARLLVASRSLLMSSSQIDTSSPMSWASTSGLSCCAVMASPPGTRGRRPRPAHAEPGGLRDPFGGNSEFGIESLVGCRNAVVVEADHLARIADDGAPAEPHPGLDANPGPDRRG